MSYNVEIEQTILKLQNFSPTSLLFSPPPLIVCFVATASPKKIKDKPVI
jgi:hypothetical protein